MSDPMDLANKTASLFFRQSDERPLKDIGLKREDDRKIMSYEISEAIKSERRRLIERFRPVVGKLKLISLYRAFNGDAWAGDMAKEALALFQEIEKENGQ